MKYSIDATTGNLTIQLTERERVRFAESLKTISPNQAETRLYGRLFKWGHSGLTYQTGDRQMIMACWGGPVIHEARTGRVWTDPDYAVGGSPADYQTLADTGTATWPLIPADNETETEE